MSKIHPNIRRIFHDLYRVTVPANMVRSIEEQRETPDIKTGDKKIDAALAKELIPIYISIAAMVNYHREGVPVYLGGREDAQKIYEAVCDHTAAWRGAVSFEMNSGDAPVEDLIDLERFAASIYDIAKFEYALDRNIDPVASIRARVGIEMGSLDAIIKTNKKLSHVKEIPVSEIKHEPNIDVFKEAIMRGIQNDRF